MRKPRFLEYYRQFEEISPEEQSSRLRIRRDEERSQALARVDPIDLSRPDWHEPPDPEIVNAATYALRRAVNRYPDVAATPAREALARRHGVDPSQVALGHGAGQLMQAALRRLAGGDAVMPWPTWGPLPALAARAGVRPELVEDGDLAAAVTERTSAVIICSPNDPTGELWEPDAVRALSRALPDGVPLLLDEALIDFAGEESSCLPLVSELPNLLVFRSFSKAWAMAGFRVGYAVGPVEAAPLLGELGPGSGVHTPGQFAVVAGLEGGGKSLLRLERRRAAIRAEHERLHAALDGHRVRTSASACHFAWLAAEGSNADGLAEGLKAQGITVVSGRQWGDEDHIRITLRDKPATERLASALRGLVAR